MSKMQDEDPWHMEMKSHRPQPKPRLTTEDKLLLLGVARDSVKAAVTGKTYIPIEPLSPNLTSMAGAFVTLKKNGMLRGCIGMIEARYPLYKVVSEMAEKAAMCDPRFESVQKDELEDMDLEISVLSPLRRIKSVEEVEIGRHGLVVEKGFYRGLLLPQVATENNWTREEFLEYTCTKAGLGREAYKNPDAHLYVFSAEVFGEKELGIFSEDGFAKGR